MAEAGMNGANGAGDKTVLIVEDNDLNMKLFRDLLDANGYRTLQTRDGLEALELARSHKPDLILMDIQLPEVSGLEVTKWLKEDEQLRAIPPGDPHAADDVGGRLLDAERRELAAQRDALLELPQRRLVEPIGQLGLAGEDDGEQFLRGRLDVGQQPDFLEQLQRQTLRFVHDEHSRIPGLLPLLEE